MKRRKSLIETAIMEQAVISLRAGSRFQFRMEEIGGEPAIRPFVVKLSAKLGDNVRANCFQGLVTVYGDNADDGGNVVMAMVDHGASGI